MTLTYEIDVGYILVGVAIYMFMPRRWLVGSRWLVASGWIVALPMLLTGWIVYNLLEVEKQLIRWGWLPR